MGVGGQNSYNHHNQQEGLSRYFHRPVSIQAQKQFTSPTADCGAPPTTPKQLGTTWHFPLIKVWAGLCGCSSPPPCGPARSLMSDGLHALRRAAAPEHNTSSDPRPAAVRGAVVHEMLSHYACAEPDLASSLPVDTSRSPPHLSSDLTPRKSSGVALFLTKHWNGFIHACWVRPHPHLSVSLVLTGLSCFNRSC